jgi:hypothetical protein
MMLRDRDSLDKPVERDRETAKRGTSMGPKSFNPLPQAGAGQRQP